MQQATDLKALMLHCGILQIIEELISMRGKDARVGIEILDSFLDEAEIVR